MAAMASSIVGAPDGDVVCAQSGPSNAKTAVTIRPRRRDGFIFGQYAARQNSPLTAKILACTCPQLEKRELRVILEILGIHAECTQAVDEVAPAVIQEDLARLRALNVVQ